MADKIAVVGIGNILMGDEGVGVHIVRKLQEESLPPGITCIDGGTRGFQLMTYFEGAQQIVFIDATMDGGAAGQVTVIKPGATGPQPAKWTSHDVGLYDLIQGLVLSGHPARIHLITISVLDIQPMQMHLSDALEGKLAGITRKVKDYVISLCR